MAIGRRSVPTPGSTTATCAPIGMYGTAHQSSSAPSRTAYLRTSWLMSTIAASGAIPRAPSRMIPADGSRVPKSVSRLTNGAAPGLDMRAAAGVVTERW